MKDKKKLDLISERIKCPDFSGAILVCDHNEVIIEDCNGYADRANKRKINIDTRLAIASGTKMFTALGIMKLIELDRLKLDDKVFFDNSLIPIALAPVVIQKKIIRS